MVSRALGLAYARHDLFNVDELPISSLESAATSLRKGMAEGSLDYFNSAVLLAELTQNLETCGKLLWEIGVFDDRTLSLPLEGLIQQLEDSLNPTS